MSKRLQDKVALVVGAGSAGPGWGNGKAAAVLFARHGAKVLCADVNLEAARETADIITGEGGEAVAVRADVARHSEIEAMVPAWTPSAGWTCWTTTWGSRTWAGWWSCPRPTGTG